MSAPSRNHSRRLRSPYLVAALQCRIGCCHVVPVFRSPCTLGRYGHAAAGGFDGRLGALGREHAGQLDRLLELARLDHLRRLRRSAARGPPPSARAGRSRRPAASRGRDRRTSAVSFLRAATRSRASAAGAAAASGRLRSRPCGSRPSATSGPCGRGRRSCRGPSRCRGRRGGAFFLLPAAGLIVLSRIAFVSVLLDDSQQVARPC